MIEVPPKVTPKNDHGYLEELTKAIFRAGFSWPVVRNKWDNFQREFEHVAIPRYRPRHAADKYNCVVDSYFWSP